MDDFSQNINNNGEKDVKESVSAGSGADDIQFEDAFDVDKLLKTLQENPEIEAPDEPVVPEATPLPVANKDKNAKKYVIYINPDNIEFMEGLSIPGRRDIINKILKEQNEISIKKKELDAKNRKLINGILACLTVIICLPLFFVIVNKATTITITNYKQAKSNFSRLYRVNGKIQSNEIPSKRTIKY